MDSTLLWLILFWSLLLPASTAAAWEPVKLAPFPQKVRTFFSLNDAHVPAGLLTNAIPLPVGGITATVRASDGATWLGTTQGLVRLDFSAPERDRRQYLAGPRYLPDDLVRQVLPDAQGGVWVRTSTGISHIELKFMTLAQKAEVFEQRIRARHDRYGLTASSHLAVAGDLSSNQMHDNDNDGLWTAMYAAAECFRYAVTKSPEALAHARKAVEAILFLEEVAGRRGFPAPPASIPPSSPTATSSKPSSSPSANSEGLFRCLKKAAVITEARGRLLMRIS